MQVKAVLETALYVDDVALSTEFYTRLFGFDLLFRSERAAGMNVSDSTVLLLFKKRGTLEPIVDDRGTIPPHDGDGNLHLGFSIDEADLDGWEKKLSDRGVDVEARYQWERGGRSVYFRDPDGHLLELVTPGCWSIY